MWSRMLCLVDGKGVNWREQECPNELKELALFVGVAES
jgi:hypothetical protein